jgi:hypothetical protein
MQKNIVHELVKLADSLDKRGMRKDADIIDRILKKAKTEIKLPVSIKDTHKPGACVHSEKGCGTHRYELIDADGNLVRSAIAKTHCGNDPLGSEDWNSIETLKTRLNAGNDLEDILDQCYDEDGECVNPSMANMLKCRLINR